MAVRIREILTCLKDCKKEVIICIILIWLTIATLFWPGNGPSVVLTSAQSSEGQYITKEDFYLCSIDFTNSKWSGKYQKFACYLEIDGQEYHLLDEFVSAQEKFVAFGLPDYLFREITPGSHKCRLIIRPSYQNSGTLEPGLIEIKSNLITLTF